MVVRGTEMDQDVSRTRPVVVGVDNSSSSTAQLVVAGWPWAGAARTVMVDEASWITKPIDQDPRDAA